MAKHEEEKAGERMPRLGHAVRGSDGGRPIMVLLDALGQRWTLRIIWELRDGPQRFRALRRRCGEPSPTLLNQRLAMLRAMGLVEHGGEGYAFTALGRELAVQLAGLTAWSRHWAATLDGEREGGA